MASQIADLVLRLEADTQELRRALSDASAQVSATGRQMESTFKSVDSAVSGLGSTVRNVVAGFASFEGLSKLFDFSKQAVEGAAALSPYQKLGDTVAEVALRAREAGDPEAAAALNALASALARLGALEVGPMTTGGEAA